MKNEEIKILLVDDDEDYLFQQRVQLETAGFKVVIAGTVTEAEEKLKQERPDIAIIDLMMEESDSGFTLCHKIKAMDESIPVIMITAVTSETGIVIDSSSTESQSWVKADAILAKPVRFEQLEREIKRLL